MAPATPHQTALLLIDIQQGFDDPSYWGTTRSTPSFESNITALLEKFRSVGAHILHVKHHSRFADCPLHPSNPGAEFTPYATPLPNERIFTKHTNSSFVGTDLEEVLRGLALQRLVVAGLTTPHCVSTTVRFASNLRVVNHPHGGNTPPEDVGEEPTAKIILVADGTATFERKYGNTEFDAETMHVVHLAALDGEFCEVKTTQEVIAELQL